MKANNENMKEKLTREWQIFLLSVSIFTRIPVSANVPYSEDRKNESYKYCGLVGLVIGVLTALVFSVANLIWPVEVSVVISMAFSIYATGAFHEDGFADTCDGFGGGFTPERKLEIMKDSRIGAYALLGMVLILLLKYTTLISLEQIPLSLIIAHVLSRSLAVSFIYTHGYVRQTELSKLKVAKSPSSKKDFVTLATVAALVLLLIPTFKSAVVLIATLFLARIWFGRWMVKQVGGYTGDALGAVQQISEVLCYLVLIAV
ncbi:adenosylcobinamide-GDP ribazoletransferase [Vibrio sp. JC009]|uniref:adenosylcobinamide-GDP ribazoletransferase n=1 Tax=Vibrio sp. JC009 TaxID=2912314 RepID=UPI0023AF4A19|nr:adenosylcobinamide-GDP ribazoletransferase [Vibrio sp. JC009]WED24585.1 adenosylcobinamide-GDP ribazoletransferase [Vibrio sp. JC009]